MDFQHKNVHFQHDGDEQDAEGRSDLFRDDFGPDLIHFRPLKEPFQERHGVWEGRLRKDLSFLC